MSEAGDIITRLALKPHPEGGWYRDTWREDAPGQPRGHASAILFLLEQGQRSHWHRIDAAEMWIFNAGSPLNLSTAIVENGEDVRREIILGSDILAEHHAQHLYRAGDWQAAQAGEGWSLVSCVVAPGFSFDGFELARPDWLPMGAAQG
ncbi:cupin domain-containing protein [Croceicoccus marinus]|uniref:Cupin n=1 Tax=Croceicoccus marinus TaxID=450378 RepID=A0A1Z1FA23_9SPHN|nr:cupin domain-containing protein [Croceicoccus marinus]ARU15678.1 cupin [Croceicoccus marinus]